MNRGAADRRLRWERRGRSDEGASLVEFALLAPLIFMLIFGMVTGGMALSYKNSMSNAAREGSRLGATLENSGSWATSVKARVLDLSRDLDDSQVCVKLEGSSPVRQDLGGECGEEPDTPPGSTGCIVKVWAQRKADLNAILYQHELTLDVQAIAKHERSDTC
jgi:hypothetical protein